MSAATLPAEALDFTHDATLRAWLASANTRETDFPIQNLPLGVFRRAGRQESFRPGVAIGDQIVDLLAACDAGALPPAVAASLAGCAHGELNTFMAQGRPARVALRHALSQSLREGSAHQAALQPTLLAQAEAEYAVPCRIGDYTDFYTGIHHATTVGKLFRPDNPLLPNYKWVPIGYHGRASSIGVSGQQFVRPRGQTKGPNEEVPVLRPTQRLDYELELGVFVGQGNALGDPILMAQAEDHAFGLVLLNDWSARDLQAWEYQPLGPFGQKLCQHDFAVDRDDGSAGTVSRPVCARSRRPATAAVSRFGQQPQARRSGYWPRSADPDPSHARGGFASAAPVAVQLPRCLLDGGADDHAPYGQWM